MWHFAKKDAALLNISTHTTFYKWHRTYGQPCREQHPWQTHGRRDGETPSSPGQPARESGQPSPHTATWRSCGQQRNPLLHTLQILPIHLFSGRQLRLVPPGSTGSRGRAETAAGPARGGAVHGALFSLCSPQQILSFHIFHNGVQIHLQLLIPVLTSSR